MREEYCQSCGMPMGVTDEFFGFNADGSKNEEYCKYCYDQGRFLGECTMEQMIEFCIPHMIDADNSMTEEKAREMMKNYMPKLKRWRK